MDRASTCSSAGCSRGAAAARVRVSSRGRPQGRGPPRAQAGGVSPRRDHLLLRRARGFAWRFRLSRGSERAEPALGGAADAGGARPRAADKASCCSARAPGAPLPQPVARARSPAAPAPSPRPARSAGARGRNQASRALRLRLLIASLPRRPDCHRAGRARALSPARRVPAFVSPCRPDHLDAARRLVARRRRRRAAPPSPHPSERSAGVWPHSLKFCRS